MVFILLQSGGAQALLWELFKELPLVGVLFYFVYYFMRKLDAQQAEHVKALKEQQEAHIAAQKAMQTQCLDLMDKHTLRQEKISEDYHAMAQRVTAVLLRKEWEDEQKTT